MQQNGFCQCYMYITTYDIMWLLLVMINMNVPGQETANRFLFYIPLGSFICNNASYFIIANVTSDCPMWCISSKM